MAKVFPSNERLMKLGEALTRYGRARFPALRDDIEGIANHALSDLWEYLMRLPDRRDVDALAIRRIAFAIFKRRASDMFRRGARHPAVSLQDLPQEIAAEEQGADLNRRALLRKMLSICVAELAEASPADRVLLAAIAGLGPKPDRAMHVNDRQRLRRLRKRMADAIRRELGEDAATLLREDL